MGFLDRPQKLWWRKALFQVHLWCGLLIGLILLVVGLSGSVLVYQHELQEWQMPKAELRPGVPRINLDDLVAKVKQRFPGYTFVYLTLPEHDGQPIVVQAEGDKSHRSRFVCAHPQTGEILEQHLTRESFLNLMFRLHMYLLAGDSGFTVNAIVALLGVGMCLTGAVLWWPGVKSWARALKVNTQASWKRVNYDLHSAVGFFTTLCLGLVFLTGVYFRFPEPFVAAIEKLTGTPGWPEGPTATPRKAPAIPIERAVAIAEREIPNAVTTYVQLPHEPKDPFYIGRKRESDGLPWAGNGVYMDPHTGAVIRREVHGEIRNATRNLLDWVGYIHFGTFAGHVSRVLWIVLGAAPGLLFITGMLMYWNRSLGKKWRRRRAV